MRVGQARACAAAARAEPRGRHVGLAALAVLQRGGRVLRGARAASAARQGQRQPALLGVRHVAAQPAPAAIVRQQHVSTYYICHYSTFSKSTSFCLETYSNTWFLCIIILIQSVIYVFILF